jgi:hypothetical protein
MAGEGVWMLDPQGSSERDETHGKSQEERKIPATLEDVADLALGEVYVRLKDPDSAKTLPGTHLLQLALFGAKLKQEKEKPIEEVSMDALSIIENSDLPPERKQEIIERERKALQARLNKLDELEG